MGTYSGLHEVWKLSICASFTQKTTTNNPHFNKTWRHLHLLPPDRQTAWSAQTHIAESQIKVQPAPAPCHPETHMQPDTHNKPHLLLSTVVVSAPKTTEHSSFGDACCPFATEILVKICKRVKSQNPGINYPVTAATVHLPYASSSRIQNVVLRCWDAGCHTI